MLLFRYSALTFNGHRIHYDRKYVTEVEGYPGLVVHGPMIATLLLDLLRHQMPNAELASFEFTRRAATFDIPPFLCQRRPERRRQDHSPVGGRPRRLADHGRHRGAEAEAAQA